MPRVAPHEPVYVTDPHGTRWRVYDQRHPRPGAPTRRPGVTAPGADPHARTQLFVREGDRLVFSAGLSERADRTDLAPATLTAQLHHALRGGPAFVYQPPGAVWPELNARWFADPGRWWVLTSDERAGLDRVLGADAPPMPPACPQRAETRC